MRWGVLYDFARKLLPRPCQIAQFLDRLRRHKARRTRPWPADRRSRSHRSCRSLRPGTPLICAALARICWNRPSSMSGFHYTPVASMVTWAHPGLLQPIRNSMSPRRRRRKSAHLVGRLAPDDQPKAGHHLLLVHVETRAPLVQCLHSRSPPQGAVGVKPLLKMNSIHRAPGQAPATRLARRGHNYGCSKDLRSNSVTGSIAPSHRQPLCQPRP